MAPEGGPWLPSPALQSWLDLHRAQRVHSKQDWMILYFYWNNSPAVSPPSYSMQFGGFYYIHTVVQPSRLPNSRMFPSPQKKPYPISSHSSFLSGPPAPSNHNPFSLWSCLFWTCQINGIIQFGVFCVWFLPLSIIGRSNLGNIILILETWGL